jgi:hypothetical protein
MSEKRLGKLQRAPSFLDLFFCGITCLINRDLESLRDLAMSENLDLVALAFDQLDLTEGLLIHFSIGVEILFQLGNIDDGDGIAKLKVGKSTLRKATGKWHLTTFEARTDATAGTGLLTFVASTGSLTKTGALSATKTLFAMLSARIGLEIMKIHFLKYVSGFRKAELDRFLFFLSAERVNIVFVAEHGESLDGRLNYVCVVIGTN